MRRDSFIFFSDWYDALHELPGDLKGEAYEAVVSYGINGEFPDGLSPMVELALRLIKGTIDRNAAAYEATKEARREAGRKGAEARWQSNGKNGKAISANGKNGKANFANGKNGLYVYDNVNENEDVVVSDDVNGNDDVTTTKKRAPRKRKTSYTIDENDTILDEEQQANYVNFGKWLFENYPYIYNNYDVMTEGEFLSLFSRHNKDLIFDVIRDLDDDKEQRRKHHNLFNTANNWANRRENNYGNRIDK